MSASISNATPRTELVRRLLELRDKYAAEGGKFYTAEEIAAELGRGPTPPSAVASVEPRTPMFAGVVSIQESWTACTCGKSTKAGPIECERAGCPIAATDSGGARNGDTATTREELSGFADGWTAAKVSPPSAIEESSRVAVPVREIIWALEREADDTSHNPQWDAASALRRMTQWQTRTLICSVGQQHRLRAGDIESRMSPTGIPEGWRLVPIVPTAKMMRVAFERGAAGEYNEGIWKAMMDAAPVAIPTLSKGEIYVGATIGPDAGESILEDK